MVPDLRYVIDGMAYFLPKDSYFEYDIDQFYSTYNTYNIKLMYTQMNVWILGLNFFDNYYTIFD